jgi:3,4-dihydroxy 2-butanone 4-phosphate synthase/GTP cyclohydrolase II
MTQDPDFAPVEDAAAALARGEMLLVVDDPDRENEGDLVMAAEFVTPAAVNFMATRGRGLICVPMLGERLEALGIPPMTSKPSDPRGTAFHVGVDHRTASTGISAEDRAAAITALADPTTLASDFTQPGHIFPLAYREGGVLERAGHTEATIDLTRVAGLRPAAVICEVAGPDGNMARLPALREMARDWGIKLVAIDDLVAYRRRRDPTVVRVSEATIPLASARFRAVGYLDRVTGHEHIALVLGNIAGESGPLVRVHSECLTGDVFGSRRCDCGPQLDLAIRMIAEEGHGVIVYLRGHEGRGIGLNSKLQAYELQDRGLDTVDANLRLGHPVDRRDYGIGMQILRDLGVSEMRLLTNNPGKRAGLEGIGLRVVGRVPLITEPTPDNVRYLEAKRSRMGHLLDDKEPAQQPADGAAGAAGLAKR